MISVTLTFNGDRQMALGSRDADYRTLLELMFKTNTAWRAEVADGVVTFRPIVIKDEKQT